MTFLSHLLLACGGQEKPFDGQNQSSHYANSLVITSVTTDPATGPGLVSWWTTSGEFKATLRDLFVSGEFASGSSFLSPDKILLSIEGTDRLEILNISSGTTSTITNINLGSTPMKHLVADQVEQSIYAVEFTSRTIEKFSLSGTRIGSPYIGTTVGACSLSSPWGITIIPQTQDIVVISSPGAAGRFSKYDSQGNCLTHSTAAPFSTGTPTAIAYHKKSNMLLVTFSSTHAIIAVDLNGANPNQIYLNSSIINTPRAIATDSDGYIYVGSSGTDTIEKLYWDGTGSAVRATSSPLIGPGAFSQNPTSITVLE